MSQAAGLLAKVPMFPLPRMVLLPKAVLPLHIFEQRYRQMIADALEGEQLLTIAHLQEGFEAVPDGIDPPVFDHCCVGTIIDHRRLEDGRYNILVQGAQRVRIAREYGSETEGKLYRRVDLEPQAQSKAFEIDLADQRDRLREIITREPIAGTPLEGQVLKLLDSPLPTAELADVLAFEMVADPVVKQAVLEERDVVRRVRRVVRHLKRLFPDEEALALREGRSNLGDD
ncbi:MAG: LON peptidase substrate-binding domain-containing protein [Planctomycetota bacterium]